MRSWQMNGRIKWGKMHEKSFYFSSYILFAVRLSKAKRTKNAFWPFKSRLSFILGSRLVEYEIFSCFMDFYSLIMLGGVGNKVNNVERLNFIEWLSFASMKVTKKRVSWFFLFYTVNWHENTLRWICSMWLFFISVSFRNMLSALN